MIIKVSPIQYVMMCENGYTSEREIVFVDDSGIYLDRGHMKCATNPHVDPEGEFLDDRVERMYGVDA